MTSETDDILAVLHTFRPDVSDHDVSTWVLVRAADEIERLRDDVARLLNRCVLLDEELAETQAERFQLIRWQAEAVEVLKAWDQVADLVPGSFLVLGARRSACVHAYIDHLQAENRALHRGLSEAE